MEENYEWGNVGPAVAANRFVVHVGSYVRIAFGEIIEPGKDTAFRTATVMSMADARQLSDLLKNLIDESERLAASLQSEQQ